MLRTSLMLLSFLATVTTACADFSAPESSSDGQVQKLRDRVQGELDELRAKAKFPGVSVAFVLADDRSAAATSGLADVENKFPSQHPIVSLPVASERHLSLRLCSSSPWKVCLDSMTNW